MKTMKYFVWAAFALALGACTDENEFLDASKQITVEAGFGASGRVATNGLSSIFEADDAIGVYVWTGGTTLPDAATCYVANNVTNTYNGTKWTATPQMYWKDAETPHYFLAVYPQTDILATTTYTLDATDQEKSDLLVATNFGKDNGGIVAQSNPVPLAFGHVMAKLRVNIKFNDEFTTAPTVEHVTVGAHATATIDWQTATATATGNATGIELPALATAAQGYACSCESVMVPQSGFKSVVMVIGGETYTFTSNQAMQLKKGTITTLNLTVGLSSIQAEDISILDWTTGASIDGYLKNISEQITAINASLTNLKDVDVALQDLIDDLEGEAVNLKTQLDSNTAADAATKQALETKIAAIEALITILQTKDTELDGKIAALQAYVNNEITATEDWATATFATLEQYTAMQAEITAIQTLLKTCKADIAGEYTAAINTAIATLETSMKTWVNTDFAAGYYDIATIDGKLNVLSDALAEGNTDLEKQITAQQAALDQAKADLKTAYEKAIKDAIDTNNGIIDTQIAAAVKTAKDDLQSQINTITTALATLQTEILGVKTDIATIEQQITAINASLTNLKDVDVALQDLIDDLEGEAVNLKTQLDSNTAADAATKQALETKIAAIEALITILQTKDAELDGKIGALETYVNSKITATEDWATATFATLAQYQAVLNDIADINLLIEQNKTAIEDITNDLASMQTAINNLHTSMQTWVNEQLQGLLADIATLQADLTNLRNSVATDAELTAAIAEQQTALDNAMNGVSQTIREAITAAIGNGGTIDLAISQKIDAAKTELQSQISTINSAITTIQDRLDKLEKRIQSIRFIPEYSDGKVKIEPGMSAVELTFIVSPKEAAAIAADKVTAFIYHTQSRAVDAQPLTVTGVSGDVATGMLTVSVTPPAEAYWATGKTANIYIQINDGNNDIISEMIPAFYYVTCNLPKGANFRDAVNNFLTSNTNLTQIKFIADPTWTPQGTQIEESGAYMVANGATLEIRTDAEVFMFNETSSSMFSGNNNIGSRITSIDFNGCINTSNVTTLAYMFQNCRMLTSLDLRGFNTANVTSLKLMFDNCVALQNITFGNSFSTNKVTAMDYVFRSCLKLTSLDLTGFSFNDNLTTQEMFYYTGGSNPTENRIPIKVTETGYNFLKDKTDTKIQYSNAKYVQPDGADWPASE